MSTPATSTSVRSSIVVEAPIDKAFSVFTEGIGNWFPREYNLMSTEIVERVFEPRVGGQIKPITATMSSTAPRSTSSPTPPTPRASTN